MELPYSYIIQQIYTYCRRPLYKKSNGIYNAECCICNEGTSSGKKRRLFYYPKEHRFQCFNCSKSWTEINWLKLVSRKSFLDIKKESASYENTPTTHIDTNKTEERQIPPIPFDSVNLTDNESCEFYINKGGKYSAIKKAIEYCNKRRLFTAINKPKSIYFSFNDFIHKNRIIIPFYSMDGKVSYYQSRTLNSDEYPKYLSKGGSKTLYGIYNVDVDIPYLFLFEGAIDAMFVKNGLAMSGLELTLEQSKELSRFLGMEVIYVFDNDKNNKEVADKIRKAIKAGKRIFVMPDKFDKYKDINEICTSLKIDEFPWKFIVENSYEGARALLKAG